MAKRFGQIDCVKWIINVMWGAGSGGVSAYRNGTLNVRLFSLASQCWQMRGNLLRVLDEMRFPARVAKDQERTETKWATKREREWERERKRERNEHKTKANELQRTETETRKEREGGKTPRTALIKHKFNLCAILASRINFRRRENNNYNNNNSK